MEQGDWDGFWRHWGKRIGSYAITVYFALRYKPQASYVDIAEMTGISYRQVLRAVQILAAYHLVLICMGVGRKKTELQLLNPVDWYIRPLSPIPDFPEPLTCEWGHDLGEDGNAPQCRHCGLLQSEDTYKQMDGGPCPISPA